MNNINYFLALNRINNVGPQTVKKLLKKWPNLSQLFAEKQASLVAAGLPVKLAADISSFDWRQVDLDLKWLESDKHHILTIEDSTYPALLKEIYDAPFVVYCKGELSCLKKHKVAMVGSRNPSPSGLELGRKFAYSLANQDICIVSGLAIGIDGASHQGALQADGITIAVMATGIDTIYPKRHQKLAAQIMEKGLIMTEFPLGMQPIAGHFPRRNRIISGLSLAILVVEAAIKSGSLITARLALEQNREVLAIPGSIYNPKARGCNYLLQQGAKLVTEPSDVLSELQLAPIDNATSTDSDGVAKSSGFVDFVDYEMTTIENIMGLSGLGYADVLNNLAELELQGKVRAVVGGYMRCI